MTRTTLALVLSLALGIATRSAPAAVYFGVSVGRASVADSDRTIPAAANFFQTPDSLSADTVPFDDDATAWGMFAGLLITPSLGFEAGYWEHGTFVGSNPGTRAASLHVEELYVGPALRYPFAERFALVASAGVSRARFRAGGSATVPLEGSPPVQLPITLPDSVAVALATPQDKTGGYWNVGVNARVSIDLEVGFTYGKRDLRVEHVSLAALSLLYRF